MAGPFADQLRSELDGIETELERLEETAPPGRGTAEHGVRLRRAFRCACPAAKRSRLPRAA